MDLPTFLALPHRFRWGGVGGDDCTTFCATWISHVMGVDPAEDLRGTYKTEQGAHRILQNAGGIVAFVEGRLKPLGFDRTDEPRDGDIGVVVAPAGTGEAVAHVGGVRFGKLWLVLGPSGIAGKKLDHIAAWRLPPQGD